MKYSFVEVDLWLHICMSWPYSLMRVCKQSCTGDYSADYASKMCHLPAAEGQKHAIQT